ncbi:MAG: translational GTPase TypA [Planctomycetes bacterium]|nr:translational GTPase TypA [Planctomycetota bacterium]
MSARPIRNLAIIAHVDHGKTTLVDAMLKQTGIFRENQQVQECVLDSNDLERERGITILAKNTVIHYRDVKINLIDTPGHADFGGEVERVLSMADGVLLLVDAAEGPMPQTRFVLGKAFKHGLVPVVMVNKVDRPDARCQEVVNEVYDLFIDLDAHDKQLEFPVLFGSGRDGWASPTYLQDGQRGRDLRPLFDAVLDHVPAPTDLPWEPLQFRVTTLDWSDFVGRIAIGRVHRGTLRVGDRVCRVDLKGKRSQHTVRGLLTFEGLERRDIDAVEAGDLCGIWGIDELFIGESLTHPDVVEPLPAVAIDEPTMSILLRVNDSPFAGRDKDGRFLTSRHLAARLDRELRTNVALRVEPAGGPDQFKVSGRGVMHLGFLLETMRREGYEFSVGKPEVIYHRADDGSLLEPIELLTVDTPERSVGKVIEILGDRRAEMVSMEPKGAFQRVQFTVPARGLIGVRNRILNATAGEATMHHVFQEYGPHRGPIQERVAGVLVSMAPGKATFYSLDSLRDRGTFFVLPATEVYEGMIVGEHCKENDLVVNLSREKKLTNVRSSTKESFVKIPPPRIFGVEEALEYVASDEYVEVTPNYVRLRKILLKENDRRKVDRAAKAGAS